MFLKEECGIFGIFSKTAETAKTTMYGLFAIQHRGQESAGISSSDGDSITTRKGMGLVSTVFNDDTKLAPLKGNISIGHVRYSTTGSSGVTNAQPLSIRHSKGELAIAHNGNLVNTSTLKSKLEKHGSIFQTTNDTEVILHLIARSLEDNIEESIADALSQVKGSYSLLFMTKNKIIALRDPLGMRPLVIGKTEDSWVFSSETTSFRLIGAEYIREVEPGEMIVIDKDGFRSKNLFRSPINSKCIFELIYFSRPDSITFGRNVHLIRKEIGKQLAKEHKIEADIVVPVPDSGISAALGYSQESGILYEKGIMRNHYIGRTFIEPTQVDRELGVRKKLTPITEVIKGKRVVLVDDSIVRGTTSKKIVDLIRKSGAKEIHMLISAPPIISPCYYGVDMPSKNDLIASKLEIEEINKIIGTDSLGYISVEGLHKAVKSASGEFCDACFTGNYPTETLPPVE